MTAFKKHENIQNPLMANKYVVRQPNGDIHIDPYGSKFSNDRFFVDIQKNGINYDYFANKISAGASRIVVQFLFDAWYGKNLAGRKRPLSANSIFNYRRRLPSIIEMLEKYAGKPLLELHEDDILQMFRGMREGMIPSKLGTPFKDTRTYAKFFAAFWRWYMRVQWKDKKDCIDLVKHLDLSQDQKPKWEYFTLKDVQKMVDVAPSLYYKALVLFLFDSGIRPPKELMNVRVRDLSPVQGSNNLLLEIRSETAKTFGRKIKLMICGDVLKRYIADSKKQPDDFLFEKGYACTSAMIKKIGYHVLGKGKARVNSHRQTKYSGGISMYDFRHCSVCHYLPLYKSENQMKYRYGWKKAEMIHYYSEFLGMVDTISDDDMVTSETRVNMQVDLEKEKQKVSILQEQLFAQKNELEEKMKRLEAMMLQKFAEGY